MSPLQQLLERVQELSAEEKRALRDAIDADLAQESHPPAKSTNQPGFGWARGMITIREDFDAPLDEFTSYS